MNYWGYLNEEQDESTAWLLEHLVKLRAWGGNFLVNVSPRADGSMPEVVYDRLARSAEWMRVNREAVLDAEPGPWLERSNVPVTVSVKGLCWYLHLLPGLDGEVVMHGVPRPAGIQPLSLEGPVDVTHDGSTLRFRVPAPRRSGLVDVLVVRWPNQSTPDPDL